MENFKIGEVVYLKSGSAAMTVVSEHNGSHTVVWHDKNGTEQRSSYPGAALTKDDPNKPLGIQH